MVQETSFLTRRHKTLALASLLIVTFAFYLPALKNEYIWDDNFYVTENDTLRSFKGLLEIWLKPGSVPQYYPLVHTSYWIEYRLWELHPFGYHFNNILLHALNAFLLWLVLKRLRVQGAYGIALVFALHPIHVESVAWITERKNTLSGFFYLSALLSYLIHLEKNEPRSRAMIFSFLLYLGALLSKTVTCTFPVIAVLILWWKHGKVRWAQVRSLIPFFIAGFILGLVTVFMEKHHVGAKGEYWEFDWVERFLIAGRAIWFYAAKLIWPAKLSFNYAQWKIDPQNWSQYIYPLSAGLLLLLGAILPRLRRSGAFIGYLYFVITLFPALGFFDVYPMKYSFVADHFQYLASIGPIAVVVSFLFKLCSFLPNLWVPRLHAVLLGVAIFLVGPLTWKQCFAYKDIMTLWKHTIRNNPDSWLAYTNMAVKYLNTRRPRLAIHYLKHVVRIRPDFEQGHAYMADALFRSGFEKEAFEQFQIAYRLNPKSPLGHAFLGHALFKQGHVTKAVSHVSTALKADPEFVEAHTIMGNILFKKGAHDEALTHLTKAIELRPSYMEGHVSLAIALYQMGRKEESYKHFLKALKINPQFAQGHSDFAIALCKDGKLDQGIKHFKLAVKIEPDNANIHYNLGFALFNKGLYEEALHHYDKALTIDPHYKLAREKREKLLKKMKKSALGDE